MHLQKIIVQPNALSLAHDEENVVQLMTQNETELLLPRGVHDMKDKRKEKEIRNGNRK